MTDYVKVPLVKLDDVDDYINQPKQKKLAEKVFHIKEFNKIQTDIIDDYIDQVVFMTDEELLYDRSDFIKNYYNASAEKDVNENDEYDSHIHTICIEIEQLRRFKRIYYKEPRPKETTARNNRITEKE